MPSNLPPGYDEDGEAVSHGRETAMYQDLLPVKAAFDKWIATYRKEMWSEEMERDAHYIEELFDTLRTSINTPL